MGLAGLGLAGFGFGFGFGWLLAGFRLALGWIWLRLGFWVGLIWLGLDLVGFGFWLSSTRILVGFDFHKAFLGPPRTSRDLLGLASAWVWLARVPRSLLGSWIIDLMAAYALHNFR